MPQISLKHYQLTIQNSHNVTKTKFIATAKYTGKLTTQSFLHPPCGKTPFYFMHESMLNEKLWFETTYLEENH